MQLSRILHSLVGHRLSPRACIFLLALGFSSFVVAQVVAPDASASTQDEVPVARPGKLMVTTTNDCGAGSLRQAIRDANARKGPDTIRFDSVTGPFATPQTISLDRPLPALTGELLIDGYIEDRLWKPSGVTVSGGNKHRVFEVAAGAKVTIRSLTIASGHADHGAGIANRGDLVIDSVTFNGNAAEDVGGGLANLGGTLTVINTTFVDNIAANAGGGLADVNGTVTVTNSTFSWNQSQQGGGLFASGTLLLRNTILANSENGADCVLVGKLQPASTHNLIEANDGCGKPVTSADPRLQKLGAYNGPTQTLPLGGMSPAINRGDNAAAVDQHGMPLRWDQRGGGDPRFVAGITDIGAFEVQAFPNLVVDTVEDTDLRACRRAWSDCSLRGAIELANAVPQAQVIRFDPQIFAEPQSITPSAPLPEVSVDLTLDASETGGITLNGEFAHLRTAPAAKLTFKNVVLKP